MSVLLPGKHVPLESSLISQAANFYSALPPESQVPRAWAICKTRFEHVTFERFALMLDVLYALQLISLEEDTIVKVREANAA
jgi:hypothetical protein